MVQQGQGTHTRPLLGGCDFAAAADYSFVAAALLLASSVVAAAASRLLRCVCGACAGGPVGLAFLDFWVQTGVSQNGTFLARSSSLDQAAACPAGGAFVTTAASVLSIGGL